MNAFLKVLIFLLCMSMAHLLHADQTNPELDKLFINLKLNTDLRNSQQLTSQIWHIWSNHKNDEINILFRQGENAMYQKDFAFALESFNKIVTLEPEFAEGWNKRATVYYLMGDYEASLMNIGIIKKSLDQQT